MQKAVNTSQINKSTVIGDVFHNPLKDDPFFHTLQGILAHRLTFRFQENPSRKNNIPPFFIEFQNLKGKGLSDEVIKISDRPQVNLTARQESRNTNVHAQPSLDPLYNPSIHDMFLIVGFLKFVPYLQLVRLLL